MSTDPFRSTEASGTAASRPNRAARRAAAKGSGRRSKMAKVALGGVAASSGLGLVGVPSAHAASFTVLNLNDAGAGSLRQAIDDANGAAGADVITFDPSVVGTITLTTGQLAISDSVDIQGPGASVVSVSGNNASRVFYLYNGPANIAVTISGLTITGGNASIGAGVVNFDEDLTLDSVTITGNTSSGDGGGLWADGFNMDLVIQNSVITGNTSGDDGGGIYVEDTGGPLLITGSAISGNNSGGSGGGIYFYDPDDDITIRDTTVSGNTAGSTGGGIYLYNFDSGGLTIDSSTISGNSASAGGGVYFYDAGPALIQNTTISGNQATAGSGGGIYLYNVYNVDIRHTTITGNSATGAGGGISVYNGQVLIDHVVVANNTAGTNNDVSGTFDVGFSLIGDAGAATINDNGGNQLGVDPLLGPLAANGGPTRTHLPQAGSPAINAGDAAFTGPPTLDQRGLNRIVDTVDIGAVEVQPPPPPPTTTTAAPPTTTTAAPATTTTVASGVGNAGAQQTTTTAAPATTAAPTTSVPASAVNANLAFTGDSSSGVAAIVGVGMIGFGTAVLYGNRRRRSLLDD